MKQNLSAVLPVVGINILLCACSMQTAPPLPDSPLATLRASAACSLGCPEGGSEQTLFRPAYILNNNRETKFANGVAYTLTKETPRRGRARIGKKDPDLPDADTLSPAAYQGANAALHTDRGHQAPLASLGNAPDWPTLNYLSNITPQKSALNQGAWARLEDAERQLANQPDVSAVHVITGPLFERVTQTLPAQPAVRIPSGYWKIIYTGTRPERGEYAVFLLDQHTPRAASFCLFQTTVSIIEQKTRPALTVWPRLPEEAARAIKHRKGHLAQRLGCSDAKKHTGGLPVVQAQAATERQRDVGHEGLLPDICHSSPLPRQEDFTLTAAEPAVPDGETGIRHCPPRQNDRGESTNVLQNAGCRSPVPSLYWLPDNGAGTHGAQGGSPGWRWCLAAERCGGVTGCGAGTGKGRALWVTAHAGTG